MGISRSVAILLLGYTSVTFATLADVFVTQTITQYHVTCPCDGSSSLSLGEIYDSNSHSASDILTLPGNTTESTSATVDITISSGTTLTITNVNDPSGATTVSSVSTTPSVSTTASVSSITSTSTVSSPSVGDPFAIVVDVNGLARRDVSSVGFVDNSAVIVSSSSSAFAFTLTSSGSVVIFGSSLIVGVNSLSGLQTISSFDPSISGVTALSLVDSVLVLPGATFCTTSDSSLKAAFGEVPSDCLVVTLTPDTDPDSFNIQLSSSPSASTTSGTSTISPVTSDGSAEATPSGNNTNTISPGATSGTIASIDSPIAGTSTTLTGTTDSGSSVTGVKDGPAPTATPTNLSQNAKCKNGALYGYEGDGTWEVLCGQGNTYGWDHWSAYDNVNSVDDCLPLCISDPECNGVSFQLRQPDASNLCGFIYTSSQFSTYAFNADTAIRISGKNSRPSVVVSTTTTKTTSSTTSYTITTPTCIDGAVVEDSQGDQWKILCGQGNFYGSAAMEHYTEETLLDDCIEKCNAYPGCNSVSTDDVLLSGDPFRCFFITSDMNFSPLALSSNTAVKISGANSRDLNATALTTKASQTTATSEADTSTSNADTSTSTASSTTTSESTSSTILNTPVPQSCTDGEVVEDSQGVKWKILCGQQISNGFKSGMNYPENIGLSGCIEKCNEDSQCVGVSTYTTWYLNNPYWCTFTIKTNKPETYKNKDYNVAIKLSDYEKLHPQSTSSSSTVPPDTTTSIADSPTSSTAPVSEPTSDTPAQCLVVTSLPDGCAAGSYGMSAYPSNWIQEFCANDIDGGHQLMLPVSADNLATCIQRCQSNTLCVMASWDPATDNCALYGYDNGADASQPAVIEGQKYVAQMIPADGSECGPVPTATADDTTTTTAPSTPEPTAETSTAETSTTTSSTTSTLCAPQYYSTYIIADRSFEDPKDGNRPPTWVLSTKSSDNTIIDHPALDIVSNTTETPSHGSCVSLRIPGDDGTFSYELSQSLNNENSDYIYDVSYWMRFDASTTTCTITSSFTNAADGYEPEAKTSTALGTEWVQFGFITRPAQNFNSEFVMQFSNCDGPVYIDDFDVTWTAAG